MAWEIRAPLYQPHASQFAYGLKGSCTLLALAACDIIAKGMKAYVGDPHVAHPDPASSENVQAVMWRAYQQARQHGLCAVNGAANQWDMLRLAGIIGLPVKEVLTYAPVQPTDLWVQFLRRHVAHADRPAPVLVQVAYGQALKDAESGAEDENGLRCHAIAIYGVQTDPNDPKAGGYICCDGDSPAIGQHPVIYSLATLAAAQPISMIAFDFVGGA
jgi:hypothetical protein